MTASNDGTQARSEAPFDGFQSDAKEAKVIVEHGGAKRGKAATALDPIAVALRRLHDDVAAEPIPDDFMNLLASIDQKREGRPS